MIVCFNCSPETKRSLDSLLQSGQYTDYSEVISLAIANLAVLQEEVLKSGGVIIRTGPGDDSQPREKALPYSVDDSGQLLHKSAAPLDSPVSVPAIFGLEGITDSPPSLAQPPDDVWAAGQEVPLDRWIFGQYNRLLPAKASCRALLHLLIKKCKGVLLEEAAKQIAEEASILGDFLAYHDQQNGIARDNTLSTAFPTTGENTDGSRQRYANQFVASVNRHGQVSGLLVDLKLVNISGGRKTARLMLTEAGWRFAVMPNSVLDGLQRTPTEKFREDERDFLLSHIAQSVPVEDFAYRAIVAAILEGANSPGTVDNVLRKHVSQDKERSMSQSFLSSQRSGAVSRMTDLGLIEFEMESKSHMLLQTLGTNTCRTTYSLYKGGSQNE